MYSLLMSVYAGEKPSYLAEALCSIHDAPHRVGLDEVVLVRDGPLPVELTDVIEQWNGRLPIKHVVLRKNSGLTAALNEGLKHVVSPWVMRFDSDDVCLPSRFRVQHALMVSGEWDLIGAQIGEFDEDSSAPHQWRRVPIGQDEIRRYSRRRNPFNHMAVCYRTELARALGGYPALPFMEDYAMWVGMLQSGARATNSPEVLVHARVGAGLYARRGGWMYAVREYQLQRHLCRVGHKPMAEGILDGLMRGAVFLCPESVRRWVYERLLRRS